MGSALSARVFYCPFVTIWVIWIGHLKLLIEVSSNTGVYRPRAKWVPPTERMGICVEVTRQRARFNILRVILKTETMNSTVHVCRCFAMPSSDIIAKDWIVFDAYFASDAANFSGYIWSGYDCMRVPCDRVIALDIPDTST